ncbi:hypothetical protein QBC38DRAFT_427935 [Podospora fimiseda]|uniref:SET domain-containing protein n=1 Tax=Podospora fimiseda TaxID=252190 RepID=A0AAN7BFX2_9PEZI|nr:hypothetical protein QBC38DRAFT_427935 [Podospora fimiseda]
MFFHHLLPLSLFLLPIISASQTTLNTLFNSLPTCPNPWSLPPLCPTPRPDPNSDDDSPDCIFTSLPFHSQGISLITTPNLAASLIPTILSRSSSSSPPSSVPWKVSPLPGRGFGLLATQKIPKHSRIMLDFPVLVVRIDFINGDGYSAKQKKKMLEEAVDRLGDEIKGKVLSLSRSREANEKDGVILNILKTNGFGIDVDGVEHLGLYLEGSRVNHNCRPNAFWRYIRSELATEVISLRTIQPGEEIAHSYVPLGYVHKERKAVLRQWGFQCRCALCSAPPAERQLADSRRERILDIHQILSKASDLPSTRRVDELVKEAITLIELEELEPQFVEYYAQFAKAYLMINELKKAREYVKTADEMWLFYGGEEHENLEGMRELWGMLEEAEEGEY